MDRRTRTIILALLSLAAIQTVYPLLGVGLITNDDLKLGNAVLDRGARGAAAMLWGFTRRHGRLDISQMASWYLPLAIDNFVYFKTVSIAAILADVVLFALLIRATLRSDNAFVLALVIPLVGLQNSWEHTPLTAFPGMFTFSLAYLLGSLLAFQRYLQNGGRHLVLYSAALWLLALCSYEIYVLYLPLFAGLALIARPTRRQALSACLPQAIAVALYLLAYATSHAMATGTYTGVTIAHASPAEIAHAVWQFSVSSLPGYFYFHPKYMFLIKASLAPNDVTELVSGSGAGPIIKAVMVVSVFAYVMRRRERLPAEVSARHIAGLAALAALYFFVPAALPALTVRGQELARGQLGIPATYFAFFAFATFSVAALTTLSRMEGVVRNAIVVTAAAALGFVSLAVDHTNAAIGRMQARAHERSAMIDAFLTTPDYQDIDEQALIYAPSLFAHSNTLDFVGAAIDPRPSLDPKYDNYWTFYFRHRGGKRVIVTDRLEGIPAGAGEFLFLKFLQIPNSDSESLLLSRVRRAADSPDTLVSDAVVVLDRTRVADRFVSGFLHMPSEPGASIRLRNGPVSRSRPAFLLDVGNNSRLVGIFERSIVQADRAPIDVDSVFVSPTVAREFKLTRTSGWLFDGWIGAEARGVTWPDVPTHLVIEAYAPDVIFTKAGIEELTLALDINGETVDTRQVRRDAAGSGGVFVRLQSNLQPERSDITVRCGPTHVPKSFGMSDVRELCVMVNRVLVRVREPGE
jgi:hypothetical protein